MKRKTSQPLLPAHKKAGNGAMYDLFPSFPFKDGTISTGYESLSHALSKERVVILDGYIGVDWKEVSTSLSAHLTAQGLKVATLNVGNCLKDRKEIQDLVRPFMGENESIFGYKTTLSLSDFFDATKLAMLTVDGSADITLVYGTGAGLCGLDGFLVYLDLPKNELQYRMRAGEVFNLGNDQPLPPKTTYKRFYFVDWVVLNKEKKRLLPLAKAVVDQQRPNRPTWTTGDALRFNLKEMSANYFRVRPWFEPGVWGGSWMKERFSSLNPNVPNYAWSFEMIVPENGLVFESNGTLLEVSFDMLMYQEQKNVLGKAADRFKDEFPIRFDFLDTFNGGNLSVQCHPSPKYIRDQFGENFTQDETYYIMDAGEDADVYLGFHKDIDPQMFRKDLEHSFETKEKLDVEKYVQKLPSKKHELFLIPHGTVHCSGINNMVLEISATPYIFTFKMYDWQRLDLDGTPRPLNIEHAFNNLDFSRKGQVVTDTLVSKPRMTESGKDWKKFHLPTHRDHFYDIVRYEFDGEIEIETQGQCHILMLVEGEQIMLHPPSMPATNFNYAETFAVPAAAKKYRLTNLSKKTAKVILSHVKENACKPNETCL
ncbi:class I mannose-6-phosphate isomerase [Maribacter sp. 2307ULW6-5]|uniref:class I mannose-6-phosphate isomerase n=1 Tax=Maribacter sp. 2307ULW6-5 TaxID=3386275 RepID=UPI0039BD1405